MYEVLLMTWCCRTSKQLILIVRRKFHNEWKGDIKFFDDSFWFIWVRGNNFQRVCNIDKSYLNDLLAQPYASVGSTSGLSRPP